MENNDIQDRIAFAQAYNLAVAMVSPLQEQLIKLHSTKSPEEIKDIFFVAIKDWQKYFYEQLKRKDVCEDCGGIDRTPKKPCTCKKSFTCKKCSEKQGYDVKGFKEDIKNINK